MANGTEKGTPCAFLLNCTLMLLEREGVPADVATFRAELCDALVRLGSRQWIHLVAVVGPARAEEIKKSLHPGLFLNNLLGVQEYGDVPFPRIDVTDMTKGDLATWHVDDNAEGIPQVTTGKTTADARGAELLVLVDGKVVQVCRPESGRSFSHVMDARKKHRVRMLRQGRRFVSCFYCPKLAVPLSAAMFSRGISGPEMLARNDAEVKTRRPGDQW